MDDNKKWEILQKEDEQQAKKKLLNDLLNATGLDEYINKIIDSHIEFYHDGN